MEASTTNAQVYPRQWQRVPTVQTVPVQPGPLGLTATIAQDAQQMLTARVVYRPYPVLTTHFLHLGLRFFKNVLALVGIKEMTAKLAPNATLEHSVLEGMQTCVQNTHTLRLGVMNWLIATVRQDTWEITVQRVRCVNRTVTALVGMWLQSVVMLTHVPLVEVTRLRIVSVSRGGTVYRVEHALNVRKGRGVRVELGRSAASSLQQSPLVQQILLRAHASLDTLWRLTGPVRHVSLVHTKRRLDHMYATIVLKTFTLHLSVQLRWTLALHAHFTQQLRRELSSLIAVSVSLVTLVLTGQNALLARQVRLRP